MKNFLIVGIALIIVIGAGGLVIIKNEYPIKLDIKEIDLTKPDEFRLYTTIYETYEKHFFELYRDDQLVYKGKYEMNLIKYNTGWMFMGNLPKKDSTKFRLKALGVDTVFYIHTMNIERLRIVLTPDKRLLTWNEKDINAWLID